MEDDDHPNHYPRVDIRDVVSIIVSLGRGRDTILFGCVINHDNSMKNESQMTHHVHMHSITISIKPYMN